MVIANSDSRHYGHLLQRISGIVFLAVPHRGSSLAHVFFSGTKVFNGLGTNSRFLEDLQRDSREFTNISTHFVERGSLIEIRTFYETKRYWNRIVSLIDWRIRKGADLWSDCGPAVGRAQPNE